MSESLIEIKDLNKSFSMNGKKFMAIKNLDLKIQKGRTLGLVGESGCGKSTIGKLLARLIKPTSGSIRYMEMDFSSLEKKQDLFLKKNIQIIFQNPYTSLNPLMTVEEIITEPMLTHKTIDKASYYLQVNKLIDLVSLPRTSLKKYPHEFSGGQRQRICIARALSLNPEFIILDEPLSALDVSIQAQVINLLIDLQKEMNLSYLFISHNLSAVKYLCDEIAVMYLGEIVERGSVDNIFFSPLHPYTKALIDSIPSLDMPTGTRKKLSVLQGELPSISSIMPGCPFASRCPIVQSRCLEQKPILTPVLDARKAACHFLASDRG